MKLKVMTYNIAAGRTYYDYAETNESPVNLEEAARVIKSEGADICGLNEVDDKTERSGKVDQVAFLENYLGFKGAFGKSIDHQGGGYGNGFVSRFNILEKEVINIPDTFWEEYGRNLEHRTILKLKLDVAGGLTILQSHFGLTVPEHEKATAKVCEIIDSVDTPLILMGDFNMFPDAPFHKEFEKRLVNTMGLLNGGEFTTFCTYAPDSAAACHIDYIYLSRDIRPLSLKVPQVKTSDHFPLVLECEI